MKFEIIQNKKGNQYSLKVDGVVVLRTDKLSESVDRLEQEVKKAFLKEEKKGGVLKKAGDFLGNIASNASE